MCLRYGCLHGSFFIWLAVVLTHEAVIAGQGLAFQDHVGMAVIACTMNGRALHDNAAVLSCAALRKAEQILLD